VLASASTRRVKPSPVSRRLSGIHDLLTPSHDGCRVGPDETPCDVDGAALGSEIL
jgi:hypothetical protein